MNVSRLFRVYVRLAGASLQAKMEYKLNFLLSTLLYALLSAVDMLLLAAVLSRFHSVGGWDVYEAALLYGLSSAGMGLYRALTAEVSWRIGWAAQGVLVMTAGAVALIRSGDLAPYSLAYLWLLPLAGGAIFCALGLATAALAF